LNTQVQNPVSIGHSRLLLVHKLYQQYAGMLLGYIYDVVKNQAIAEQYLVAVFKDAVHELNEFANEDVSTFCYLQALARKKLTEYFRSTTYHKEENILKSDICNNKYIKQMTNEQRLVFCGIHWHGKTVASLATELNKPEENIRKILKDCFTIIRNSN
jgi:DNA-directed RNA polymerase specialized sigma24 family protein